MKTKLNTDNNIGDVVLMNIRWETNWTKQINSMILCSIQKAKQKFFAFPQPRECSLITCSTIWGIFHSRVATKRLLYKKRVALASLSDFESKLWHAFLYKRISRQNIGTICIGESLFTFFASLAYVPCFYSSNKIACSEYWKNFTKLASCENIKPIC